MISIQLKISTDYAVRTLIYLAQKNKKIISSTEVAQAMKIPQKYLIRLGKELRDAGLIISHPGTYGGYSLAKKAEEISLYDVVALMEGTVKLNRCLEEDCSCNRNLVGYCPVHKSYTVMQKKWENFLKGITIADLKKDISEKEIEDRIDGLEIRL